MAESSKKSGFFGKFFNVLSGKPTHPGTEEEQPHLFDEGKKESIDLAFVKSFTASGGKFLYCEKESEAHIYLKQITKESGISAIFCNDANINSILKRAGIVSLTDEIGEANAFCSACEYLISFNGGIMITAKQTLGKKLSELPETFITVARTSQIVENLRAGLTGIRTKYEGDIPSQITTIKGPIKDAGNDENGVGNTCNKEIYLLLLEDQL